MFNTTDENGKRRMIIIETNSCASGQKSMPLIAENQRFAGYKILLESIFEDLLGVEKISTEVEGDLAVVFDKNLTENSAYSAVLAELSKERVWLVEYVEGDELSATVRWSDGVMYVRDIHNQWHPIRACLRYVTQKPWNKIPLNTKTRVVNPIAACLAGGRNKIMASYAYQKLNEELEKSNSGLSIRLPYSLINVNKSEIPSLFFNDKKLNGRAVVKVPYSNCGQGVYTLFNKYELDDFMRINHKYDKFIVQSLIGHNGWRKDDDDNSKSFYHIGTVPDAQNNIYVYDLRMIVTSNKDGFCPVSMNCRRARRPLNSDVNNVIKQDSDNDNTDKFSSWDMLGTNLSVKIDKNIWDTESERLLIMDNNDFNVLGLGLDDLIDAYIQTVLSVISIDKMCIELLESNNQKFNYELFKQLNPDDSLINEIRFN